MKTWSQSETISLVSWLDFCIENGGNFWLTITGHLKKCAEHPTDAAQTFTEYQIKNKLLSLGRPYGVGVARATKADIMRQGSKCLANLRPDLLPDINAALQQLRSKAHHDVPERNDHQVSQNACFKQRYPRIPAHDRGENVESSSSGIKRKAQISSGQPQKRPNCSTGGSITRHSATDGQELAVSHISRVDLFFVLK